MIIDSVSLKRHEEPKALKLEIATHEGLQDTKPHPKLLQSGPCCFSAQSWALVYGVVFWLGLFVLFIGVLADLWYLWMIGGVMMLLAWLPNIIDVFFAKVSESVDRKTVAVRNKDSVAKLVGVAPKLYHKVVCSHSAAPGVGSGGRRESTFGFGETRVVTHKEWVPFEVYPEWVTTLISDYDFDKSKEFSMLQFDTSLVFADEDSVHWMQETAKSIQMQYREKDDQLDYALVMDPTFPTDVMLKDGEAEPPEWLHPNCYKCLGFAALNCCLIRVVDAMSEHLRLNVQKKISFYANDPNYQQDQAAAAAAAAAYDGGQQEYAAGQEIEVGQEQYADYDQQAYAGQEYDQQAYAEQEYAGQEYNEQAYDGQEYDQQAYDQQGYDQQAYDGQEYAAGEYAEAQSQSQPSAE